MSGFRLICGVDEAGRGPLVGSVFAAAVILPARYELPGLNDSKKLTEKKRDALFPLIKQQALAWAIAEASAQEIDTLNILQATMLAMRRAVAQLQLSADEIIIDGNRIPTGLTIPARALVQGDALEPAISAASVLAKVARDASMHSLHQQYPEYGFSGHKGYPTREHLQALERFGPLPEHRQSFGPVRQLCAQGSLW
ncbi:ribonuclease HII [Chitinilyticum piscinae]|uniref:Ribonuclease HII n=1 Tax=Chitinilyticum piscinae TaxID=2866724 RepID=A0A8J7K8E6_9NEIS|nr:ribonuclease HII [Chitinilyticum piscinae]MBE9609403.1 ribonuclease HII [Chitinilyticum piscinae]